MPVPRYLPHLLYSTALTSVSIHLLWQRKLAEEDRARATAQISILNDIIQQLRSGKPLADEEIIRLRNLARVHRHSERDTNSTADNSEIRWTDVLWGRKASDDQGVTEGWEQRDLDQIRKELEKDS
ncbi:hypothetical protein BV22DRAFT_1030427 [Leucogyrophana mollusca]|uniref:Uncharacterized protein n=1 Tax=Leucogyrophana mollusca TaxID=85980 RepID=A0ACB8BT90_9AGAM|nr:hypothetical protein BV22DRAFT_1030427 [Leucogyrophana mollusca]